jgi:hypothetical protein
MFMMTVCPYCHKEHACCSFACIIKAKMDCKDSCERFEKNRWGNLVPTAHKSSCILTATMGYNGMIPRHIGSTLTKYVDGVEYVLYWDGPGVYVMFFVRPKFFFVRFDDINESMATFISENYEGSKVYGFVDSVEKWSVP